MSACKLTEDTSAKASLKGTTLFAKGDDCIAETAVYLSKANARKSVSNVILFSMAGTSRKSRRIFLVPIRPVAKTSCARAWTRPTGTSF